MTTKHYDDIQRLAGALVEAAAQHERLAAAARAANLDPGPARSALYDLVSAAGERVYQAREALVQAATQPTVDVRAGLDHLARVRGERDLARATLASFTTAHHALDKLRDLLDAHARANRAGVNATLCQTRGDRQNAATAEERYEEILGQFEEMLRKGVRS